MCVRRGQPARCPVPFARALWNRPHAATFLFRKTQSVTAANAIILNSNTVLAGKTTSPTTRYCGRYFQTSVATFLTTSICCKYNMPPDFLRNHKKTIIFSYSCNYIALINFYSLQHCLYLLSSEWTSTTTKFVQLTQVAQPVNSPVAQVLQLTVGVESLGFHFAIPKLTCKRFCRLYEMDKYMF